MRPFTSVNLASAGAIAAAVGASACCVGPLLLALLSVGGVGAVAALEPWRPVFVTLTVVLLGVAWGAEARAARSLVEADDCGCDRPRARRAGRGTLRAATVLAALALAFPYAAPMLVPAGPASSAPEEGVRVATFEVRGMTCAACSVTVRTAAMGVDGALGAEVDVAGGRADVRFDPRRVSPADIAERITAAGYPATIAPGDGG